MTRKNEKLLLKDLKELTLQEGKTIHDREQPRYSPFRGCTMALEQAEPRPNRAELRLVDNDALESKDVRLTRPRGDKRRTIHKEPLDIEHHTHVICLFIQPKDSLVSTCQVADCPRRLPLCLPLVCHRSLPCPTLIRIPTRLP